MNHSNVLHCWLRFALFLAALIGGSFFLPLQDVFLTNPYFNGSILAIGALGLLFMCWEFYRLWREEKALFHKEPLLILQPLVHLYERSSYASRQSIAMAIESCHRHVSYEGLKYLSSALIFIGLLGTLWGLSQTLSLIAEVVGHLPTEGLAEAFFETLKSQLQKPLSGMGVAFSSSLFGIATSLALKFCLLQLEGARESFFKQVEEWVLALFKTVEPAPVGEENGVLQATVAHWLEGLDKLIRLQQAYDQRQQDLNSMIIAFGERTKSLSELMKAQHHILNKWAEEQIEGRYTLERVGQKIQDLAVSGDEAIKNHLSQISATSQEILKCLYRPMDNEPSPKALLRK